MSSDSILNEVGRYYSRKIQEHGATPAGVDWNSAASQELRFDQLLRMVSPGEPFSTSSITGNVKVGGREAGIGENASAGSQSPDNISTISRGRLSKWAAAG